LYVHDFPIVSIASGDGLPELYHVIKDYSASLWTKPQLGSKIKKINGKEPQDYMDDFIGNSSEALDWVDPDARYNQILYGFPEGTFRGRFARRNMWDGEDLRITWENGTDTLVEFTVQLLNGNMHQNGKLLFKDTESLTKLCFLSEEELASKVKREIEGKQRDLIARQASAPDGYPSALADSAEYAMSTYAVPGDSETVALAIRTFEETDMDSSDFVHAMSTFLEDQISSWKESGYKRLIIDVSNNDGGKAILPYDVLKQLFPSKEDFPTVNMHYSPITWAYMHSINQGKENELYRDVNMHDFEDMKDLLGPVQKDGDWFTKMWKQDYVQFGEKNYGINVSTVASSEQPFSADNIAVISNGLCASACHSLVESLSLQGVRTFAFGGRASKSSPMQPVGGTKGGKVLRYDLVRQALADMGGDDTVIAAAGPADTWQLDTLPVRIKNLNVNSENKFRDNTSLPLQFVYTPACNRFFVDSSMLQDVANVWKKTRAVAWGSDGKASECVDYTPAAAGDEESASSDAEAASDDDEKSTNGTNGTNGTGRVHGHRRLLPWLGLWGGVWLGFLLL
jgi:hypothetical protein